MSKIREALNLLDNLLLGPSGSRELLDEAREELESILPYENDDSDADFLIGVYDLDEETQKTSLTVFSNDDYRFEHLASAASRLLFEAASQSPDGFEMGLDVIRQMALSRPK